jgi:hypothetical protein
MPIFNYWWEYLISRHIHRALYQAIFTSERSYFLLFFLRWLTSVFFLLRSGRLCSCQLFCCFPCLKNLRRRLRLPNLPIEFQDVLINFRHWVPFRYLNWKGNRGWHESMLGFVLCHKDFVGRDATARLQGTAHAGDWVHIGVHCFLNIKNFSARVNVEVWSEKTNVTFELN